MSEVKAFASLTSGLLARKGQAKPAMKPQGYTMTAGNIEDLGWNDMGYGAPAKPFAVDEAPLVIEPVPSPVAQQQDAIAEAMAAILTPVEEVAPAAEEVPYVSALQVKPARAPKAAKAVAKPAPVKVTAPVARVQVGGKAKAAFTLRLDPDRHLKLRLACAVGHRSAQVVVTEALDAFLATVPGMDALTGAAQAQKN